MMDVLGKLTEAYPLAEQYMAENYNRQTGSATANRSPEDPFTSLESAVMEGFHPLLMGTVLSRKTQFIEFTWFGSVILLLLSFLVASLFFQHIEIREDAKKAPTRKVQDLVSLLNQAESKQKQLQEELQSLRGKYFQVKVGTQASEKETLRSEEYQKLAKMAGLTKLEGEGLVVQLSEPVTNSSPQKGKRHVQGRNNIQADDILKVVNELKAAGASAVSINGQRLVMNSEIVNSGPVLMVNQTRIATPIEIKALGTPKNLRAALEIPGGILEYLAFFGIQNKLQETQKLLVPAYSGELR